MVEHTWLGAGIWCGVYATWRHVEKAEAEVRARRCWVEHPYRLREIGLIHDAARVEGYREGSTLAVVLYLSEVAGGFVILVPLLVR